MGLAVDTNKTFPYVLLTDRHLPEGERPTFHFRFLSARKASEVEDLFEASCKGKDHKEVIAKALEGLKLVIAGWDRQAVPFAADSIDEVLSRGDIVELRDNILHEMIFTELEKKKGSIAVAIYYGRLCQTDSRGKCVSNCPTPEEPAIFECVSCRGRGCQHCNGQGRYELTSCARKEVTSDIWQMFKWVRRAEEGKGSPMGGGLLDQTLSFLEAWDFFSAEMNHNEAKLGINRGK